MILPASVALPIATSLVWGAGRWLTLAAPAVAILVLAVVWNYWRAGIKPSTRLLASRPPLDRITKGIAYLRNSPPLCIRFSLRLANSSSSPMPCD